jgi:hypothetical protein
VITSRRDAGRSSCSSGLAGAGGGEASRPVKLLPWLAGLMGTGDRWGVGCGAATSRLGIAVFA